MPYFEPIIGESFSDISRQRQFWAQQNNQTEVGNIGRANAAQQNLNNYFANEAAQRQRAMENDAAIERRSYFDSVGRADSLAEKSRRNYQWDKGAELKLKEISSIEADNKRRLEEEQYQFDTALEFERKTADEKRNNEGMANAVSYASSKRQLEALEESLPKLESETEALEAEVGKLGKLSPKYGQLVALRGQLRKANAAKERIERLHQNLIDNELPRTGFSVNEDKGVLIDKATGKEFSFRAAVKAALESVGSSDLAVAPEAARRNFEWANSTSAGTAQPKPLNKATAKFYLDFARGDKALAREIATKDGYVF